ncbi:hypothetical protein [Sedimenticola hydrogenitrophicus]|jgi:hypothetical protein|uniref:hypothetical protein n=1 Tax=Sedimenticola hydrogenitrophicus TaxID=2967975 RepID=UPI0023AF569E|nr:hypothetical protein [Sedimenticola hydrogenitrophicus]
MRRRLAVTTWLAALSGLALGACSEPPPPPAVDPIERQLDTQRELMHQTREVIRYLDEQERLRREQLEEVAD